MKECEMCGRSGELLRAKIEDTVLMVCRKCSALGAAMEETPAPAARKAPSFEIQEIVPDFAQKIKEARESAGMSKEDLAKKIGIASSLVTRIEKGMRPAAGVTKKLERALGIALFYRETAMMGVARTASPEITLGDVVALRIKRK